MFKSARLHLTAWYLLIIMFISMLFSVVIYKEAEHELERISRRQQLWSQRMMGEFFRPADRGEWFDSIVIDEIRQRIIIMLFLLNTGILGVSGIAGYFLAGRTLKPIKEMVEEQNRFISDASHELRTPLTSLKSAMEVHLRDRHLTLKDAKILIANNIEDVNKLQLLSDALLKLAQFQTADNKWIFEKLSLSDIIKSAIRKVEYPAKQKFINIKNQSKDYNIVGNRDGLIDLLVILLDNAIKYSPVKKSIIIQSNKTDGMVVVNIKDQGIGIDDKDLPHIFDRFYRADIARSKTNVAGYGLGLSIAKKIVILHHGSITVESKTSDGTKFIIHLPVKQTKMGIE